MVFGSLRMSDEAPRKDKRSDEPNATLRLDADSLQRYREGRSRHGSLLVIAGNDADIGCHVVVDGPVVVGRDAAGLKLRDGNTSRQHLVVRRDGDRYTLADLGSTNGTMLNGDLVRGATELRDGDKILLGQTVIKFHMVDDTEASYHQQVERLVSTDDLTGLVTKQRFDAHLDEAIRAAQVSGSPVSAMMMDMDGLKSINDRHGHQVGANTIRQVGQLLHRLIGGEGEACRFGGDEFSAFFPGANIEAGMQRAESIRAAVEREPFSLGDIRVTATISIGVAVLTAECADAQALLARADAALYRAKAKGRNAVAK